MYYLVDSCTDQFVLNSHIYFQSIFQQHLNRFHVSSVSFTLKLLTTILIMRIAVLVQLPNLLQNIPAIFILWLYSLSQGSGLMQQLNWTVWFGNR